MNHKPYHRSHSFSKIHLAPRAVLARSISMKKNSAIGYSSTNWGRSKSDEINSNKMSNVFLFFPAKPNTELTSIHVARDGGKRMVHDLAAACIQILAQKTCPISPKRPANPPVHRRIQFEAGRWEKPIIAKTFKDSLCATW